MFSTENTLTKLLCKPKDQVGTEDKNNTVYKIDSSNSKAVYLDESKWSLNHIQMSTKDLSGIVKRIKLSNTVRKKITTLAGIRGKLLIRKAS